ncbi:MAG: hypothetical protein DCC71_25545 [Proteobacteria bacterium]|nr:MAG: hypothetical protein DCC71_25545 [Pseudomonadota bacterium]
MRARILASLVLALLALAPAARAADGALALTELDGRAVALAPAPGGSLVVHFWATWCPSCKAELADLDRAARACEGTPVEVVTVDVGEDADTVRRWLADRPLRARLLLDPGGRAWRRSGGREMPANLIWTSERQSWAFGPSSEAAWRERLAALGCAFSQ